MMKRAPKNRSMADSFDEFARGGARGAIAAREEGAIDVPEAVLDRGRATSRQPRPHADSRTRSGAGLTFIRQAGPALSCVTRSIVCADPTSAYLPRRMAWQTRRNELEPARSARGPGLFAVAVQALHQVL